MTNNVDIKSMVAEFLELKKLENEQASLGLNDKAQVTNERKWKIKKLAREYGVEKEFDTMLKESKRIN